MFLLALVGVAVVVLIGVLIYHQVTEAELEAKQAGKTVSLESVVSTTVETDAKTAVADVEHVVDPAPAAQ